MVSCRERVHISLATRPCGATTQKDLSGLVAGVNPDLLVGQYWRRILVPRKTCGSGSITSS